MGYALVTGSKGGRRSAAMLEVAGRLAARGLRVAGFVQLLRAQDGEREAIELMRLAGGERLALARTGGEPDEATQQGVCTLVFETAGFAHALAWLREDAPGADVLLLDGLGRLELRGQGHRASIDHALATPGLTVLSVRDEHLFETVETLGLGEPVAHLTVEEGPAARDAFVDALAAALGAG